MATKIRLRRAGRRKQATFRIIVTGKDHAPAGRFTEQIGKYNPRTSPSFIEIDEVRALHWLRQGAEASDTVRSLFRKAGIMQKLATGADGEGVITIGDVGGRTVFPQEALAQPSEPAAKATAEAAPAGAEEAVAEEETEDVEAEEPEEEVTAEAEAVTEEAEAEPAEEEEGEEEEEEKSAAPEAKAEDSEAAAEEEEEAEEEDAEEEEEK